MARSAAFLLAVERTQWTVARALGDRVERIGQVDAEQTDSPLPPADQLGRILREAGYRGQGLVLGLPSEMVLTAQVDCENLPRKNRRAAMLYRLEEQLPLDAERLTVDFLPPIGGRALGMAVQTEHVRRMIEHLSEAGIETAAVCPTSLLALWGLCRRNADLGDYCLLAANRHVDVFRMAGRRPLRWHVASGESGELVRSIHAELLSHPPDEDRPPASVFGDLDEALCQVVGTEAGIEWCRRDGEPVILAAAGSARASSPPTAPHESSSTPGLSNLPPA